MSDQFDCEVVHSHRSLTLLLVHVLLEQHCGKYLVSDYFSKSITDLDTGQTEDISTKNSGKMCVFVGVLLACLFIYSFVYLLFGSGYINY